MHTAEPLAVLVNGLPGSGKTTLARAVARHLGLPLFSKDVIKETCADVLGTEGAGWPQRRWNAAIGAAASETMWALLADAPAGAVLESCWPADVRHFVVQGLSRAGDPAAVEIWCNVPLQIARQRFEARHPRHPIHGDLLTDEEWEHWRRTARPLQVAPVRHVDTTQLVDTQAIIDWIRTHIEFQPGSEWSQITTADSRDTPGSSSVPNYPPTRRVGSEDRESQNYYLE